MYLILSYDAAAAMSIVYAKIDKKLLYPFNIVVNNHHHYNHQSPPHDHQNYRD